MERIAKLMDVKSMAALVIHMQPVIHTMLLLVILVLLISVCATKGIREMELSVKKINVIKMEGRVTLMLYVITTMVPINVNVILAMLVMELHV
jgi:hypothetical protein